MKLLLVQNNIALLKENSLKMTQFSLLYSILLHVSILYTLYKYIYIIFISMQCAWWAHMHHFLSVICLAARGYPHGAAKVVICVLVGCKPTHWLQN